MNWKQKIKSALPFILGLAIGGGLTRNKTVFTVFIFFIVFMLIKNVVSANQKKLKNKKGKKKVEGIVQIMLDNYVDLVESGFLIGDKIFKVLFATWTFFFNIFLLVASIVLLVKDYYMWAALCFVAMQLFMVQNQMLRKLGEKK